MGGLTLYVILIFILAVLIFFMPQLIQARIWITRKIHLFRLADWMERNSVVIVKWARLFLAAVILFLLFLMVM